MNGIGHKPAHAAPAWQEPASTRKARPGPTGGARWMVFQEGAEGSARPGFRVPHPRAEGPACQDPGFCGNPPPATPRWLAVFFSVLAGACQFGTAWSGLRLNSFIQDPGLRQGKTPIRPLLPTNITYVYLQPPPPPGRDRTTSDERAPTVYVRALRLAMN